MSLAGELLSGKCRASIWVKTRKHLEMIVVLKETDREQALETLLRDSREKKRVEEEMSPQHYHLSGGHSDARAGEGRELRGVPIPPLKESPAQEAQMAWGWVIRLAYGLLCMALRAQNDRDCITWKKNVKFQEKKDQK